MTFCCHSYQSSMFKLKPHYLILDFYVDIENKSDYNASGGITIVGADCIKPTTKVDERNEFYSQT